MPALRGSLTYARFFVEGKLTDDFNEKAMRTIRHRAMRPLEPDDEELERSGWCKIGEPFVTDLAHEDVFFNEYLNLGFRTDKWQLPTSLLKVKLREAEAAYLEKKGREKLSRKEKTELKLMVAKKLRRQTEPATRVVDVVWSLNERLVRFFSHSEKPAAAMCELFKTTFGLTLVPESPYTLAERVGLDKTQKAAWGDLDMTYFGAEQRRSDDFDAAAEEEE
ncbi:MAG: recombination-associated protein RdgC [Labilithrix sp.]